MGKGRRESEGSRSSRRPSGRSPTSAEKRMSFESVSSLPEIEPDPEAGSEQEVFAAVEGPSAEEMPSDTESADVLETPLDAHQGLLGMDPPGDMVGFVAAESTEDLKALSSEEEEEMGGAAQEPESLLPPSVLDQASVIAERFVSSFSRRSSVAQEDGKSSGFGSPRLVSRSSSVLSLEGSEKGLARRGSATDSLSCQLSPEVDISVGGRTEDSLSVNGMESPSPGCPVEPDWSSCKKKESALSTRDRLLLDKIKSYYENAEHHDAGFSVRRRESLSYIPKGLVRNSVSRFNSLPRPDPEPVPPVGRKRQVGSRPTSWGGPRGPPVNRSHSVPENMVEPPLSARVGRCRSLSTKRGRGGGEAARSPGPLPQSKQDGGETLYVTADLTLEDNRRVIVMEKGPLPGPTAGLEESSGQGPSLPGALLGQGQDFQQSAECRLKEEGPRDPADPSQQGRVRNLREKFQALNSVG
uniref:Pleckstrin homology and RhoGEF domain containing G3 n=1 Tax=Mandrillus leucophaeus TaxID=9568 RepID=A0A2K5ZCQ0_MANLE